MGDRRNTPSGPVMTSAADDDEAHLQLDERIDTIDVGFRRIAKMVKGLHTRMDKRHDDVQRSINGLRKDVQVLLHAMSRIETKLTRL